MIIHKPKNKTEKRVQACLTIQRLHIPLVWVFTIPNHEFGGFRFVILTNILVMAICGKNHHLFLQLLLLQEFLMLNGGITLSALHLWLLDWMSSHPSPPFPNVVDCFFWKPSNQLRVAIYPKICRVLPYITGNAEVFSNRITSSFLLCWIPRHVFCCVSSAFIVAGSMIEITTLGMLPPWMPVTSAGSCFSSRDPLCISRGSGLQVAITRWQ